MENATETRKSLKLASKGFSLLPLEITVFSVLNPVLRYFPDNPRHQAPFERNLQSMIWLDHETKSSK